MAVSRESRLLMRSALDAVDRGLAVFPLQPGSGEPIRGVDWPRHCTRDPDAVREWWGIAPFNIGIATGRPSGILVVAVRPPHQIGLPHGLEQLRDLVAAAGGPDPADTDVVTTPTGCFHLYYRLSEGARLPSTDGVLGVHIDTLGEAGFVAGPGSVSTRHRYKITKPGAPQPLPAWLAALLTQQPAAHAEGYRSSARRSSANAHRRRVQGRRPARGHDRPRRSAAERAIAEQAAMLVRDQAERVANAQPAALTGVLFLAAARLGRLVADGRLTDHTVRDALRAACQRHEKNGRITAALIQATVTTGLRRHARPPHDHRPETMAAPLKQPRPRPEPGSRQP
jgi:hypothetical protein